MLRVQVKSSAFMVQVYSGIYLWRVGVLSHSIGRAGHGENVETLSGIQNRVLVSARVIAKGNSGEFNPLGKH